MTTARVTIPLRYGSTTITIQVPRTNLLQVFSQQVPQQSQPEAEWVQRAIQAPLNAPPLNEWSEGKRIALLLADATREVPNERLLQWLLPQIQNARQLQVLITTGTHQWDAPDNRALRQRLTRILKEFPVPHQVELHNCFGSHWWEVGTTRSGTPIRVNPLLKESDGILIFSDVKPHYFGGYSNVVKHVVPGVCAFETAERNHSWTLDPRSRAAVHPWHPNPHRRDNPLAADMVEAFAMITQNHSVWALGVITYHNRVVWATGGDPREVMGQAFLEADRWLGARATPADVLVVSSGGYPHDESLYIAQRALELSRPAVKRGGRVLFLAECRNGIGPPASIERFYRPLLPENRHQLKQFTRERYTMYAHKPLRLWQFIQDTQFLGMKSALAPEVLKNIDITPVQDVQSTLEEWIKQEPHITINVVTDGNKLALYA